MPRTDDRRAATHDSKSSIRARARWALRILTATLVLAASALVGVATVHAQVKATINRKALQSVKAVPNPTVLLPDFVIKCASVTPYRAGWAANRKPGFHLAWVMTVTVANVGKTAALIDSTQGTHGLILVTNSVPQMYYNYTYGGYSIRLLPGTWTFRPGETKTVQFVLGYNNDPPGVEADGVTASGQHVKFYFDVEPGWQLKESRSDDNRFGPVTVTQTNTCPRSLSISKLGPFRPTPLQRASTGLPNPASTKASVQTSMSQAPRRLKGRPATTPTNPSAQSGRVTMHKIGLAPRSRMMTSRAPTAVHLPSGWTTVGGTLRASRPGLRLSLSAGHTLLSKLGRRGLNYELLDASGRVIKRISAKASIRLLHGNTLMLLDPKTHRQDLLGQIARTAMPSSIIKR